jgi:hypothetical protein
LHNDLGQTVVTAAFIGDIFSIIVLEVLLDLAAGDITAWSVSAPFIYCVVFLGIGVSGALKVFPSSVSRILRMIPVRQKGVAVSLRDEVHLLFLLSCIAGLGKLGAIVGSELLGTFIADMLFCQVPNSVAVWNRSMIPVCEWLIRLFFSASVACFSIPSGEMFSPDGAALLWKGLVVAALPAIATKVLSGYLLNCTTMHESK